jgi:hypothetical protein
LHFPYPRTCPGIRSKEVLYLPQNQNFLFSSFLEFKEVLVPSGMRIHDPMLRELEDGTRLETSVVKNHASVNARSVMRCPVTAQELTGGCGNILICLTF